MGNGVDGAHLLRTGGMCRSLFSCERNEYDRGGGKVRQAEGVAGEKFI